MLSTPCPRLAVHRQILQPRAVPLGLRPVHNQPSRLVLASAAASDDPYQVLGIKPDADNNEINRAYSRLKYNNRNNQDMLRRVEDAHSKLMLGSLSARLQGKGVAKGIKYADREPLFPWRPKRWDATPKIIMIFGAVFGGISAMSCQSPNMGLMIAAMFVGIVGNYMKQNAISPPPKDPNEAMTDEEAGRGSRNLVRAALLGIMATVAATMVASIPDQIVQQFGLQVPRVPGIMNILVTLKIVSVAIANWVMVSYYY